MTRLRKIFGYGAAPLVVLLFVVADVLLAWGRFGDLNPPTVTFAVMGVAGVMLIRSGLAPDAVAHLVKLNPKATIEGASPGR